MGLIHLYCGDGKGKTTASLGLALRACGSGMKVLYVQFFKDGESSEFNAISGVDGFSLLTSDDKFPFYFYMTENEKKDALKSYTALLVKAIALTAEYDMIVLDEVISAYNFNCIDKEILIDFLKNNNDTEIVLTGRNPDIKIIELCDYVTEMKCVNHPYNRGIEARKGIEY